MKTAIIAVICIALVLVLIYAITTTNKANNSYSSDDEIFNNVLNGLNYECNLLCEGWPDAIFEFEFTENPTTEMMKKVYDALADFVYEYDRKCEETNSENVIHYICDWEDAVTDRNVLSIHIDFGSCDPMVLTDILTLLNRSEFCISKVDIL